MLDRILIWICIIYFTISQCLAVYYMWEYSQHHGFWASIIIGPIIAEIKGLLWILMGPDIW
jgi:hypothetical protein